MCIRYSYFKYTHIYFHLYSFNFASYLLAPRARLVFDEQSARDMREIYQ